MTQGSPQQPADADREFVARLRDGDEAAFSTLVERYHGPMVRLATAYVPSYAVAEEVAQEAWLGVLNGPVVLARGGRWLRRRRRAMADAVADGADPTITDSPTPALTHPGVSASEPHGHRTPTHPPKAEAHA